MMRACSSSLLNFFVCDAANTGLRAVLAMYVRREGWEFVARRSVMYRP